MLRTQLLTVLAIAFLSVTLNAQTAESIQADIAAKEAQVGALQGEIDALKASMPPVYGWKLGTGGTLGLNFSQFSQWLGAENPNTFSSNIGFAGNGFANLLKEKFFWRNDGSVNIGFTKLNTDTQGFNPAVNNDYQKTADAINISSLYGYKLNEKWAVSALGEYRSTVLNNFNNPGFLDIGAGVTWTPISDLVVVIHPLNYNFIFAKNESSFESSLGAKFVADYTRSLGSVAWKSKLSGFLSYADPTNFSNFTWVNGLSATIFKGIGIGLEFGIRNSRQEGFNNYLNNPDNAAMLAQNPEFKIGDLNGDDNPMQTYWVLGFSYTL